MKLRTVLDSSMPEGVQVDIIANASELRGMAEHLTRLANGKPGDGQNAFGLNVPSPGGRVTIHFVREEPKLVELATTLPPSGLVKQ